MMLIVMKSTPRTSINTFVNDPPCTVTFGHCQRKISVFIRRSKLTDDQAAMHSSGIFAPTLQRMSSFRFFSNCLRFSRTLSFGVWGVVAYLLCIPEPVWAIAYIPPITQAEIAETRRKAMAGDAGAEYTVGAWYQSGINGFPANLTLAAKWYLKAAEQGDTQAQSQIGEMYEFGEGVRQDHEKAVSWIRKATIQYSASSMMIAGRYAEGINAPQNLRKAIDWYRMSAEAGHVVAQTLLGNLYATPAGGENYAEAASWYRKATDAGWPDAMTDLANLYSAGKGVPQDYGEAETLYRKSVAAGGFSAQYPLGLLYEQGLGVPRNPIAAMELYQTIAHRNDDARRRLFALFDAWKPVPSAPADGINWYREAAAKGDATAQVGLGLRYEFGEGVAQNVVVAYALYELAATSSDQQPGLPNFIRLSPPGRFGGDLPQLIMKLEQGMAKPGNLLATIDYFIAHPPPDFIGD
jgi:TPR repeat protein